jgi:transcription initiation factor IIE alpha subunit
MGICGCGFDAGWGSKKCAICENEHYTPEEQIFHRNRIIREDREIAYKLSFYICPNCKNKESFSTIFHNRFLGQCSKCGKIFEYSKLEIEKEKI